MKWTGYILLLMLSACNSSVVENYGQIENNTWDHNKPADIFVTVNPGSYQLFLELENKTAYPYNNIWLKLTCTKDKDTNAVIKSRYNFPLSTPDGKWLGRGPGKRIFNNFLISNDFVVKEHSAFNFQISQEMRDDQLAGIKGVGIKLVKK